MNDFDHKIIFNDICGCIEKCDCIDWCFCEKDVVNLDFQAFLIVILMTLKKD